LPIASYLRFPFRVGPSGALASNRRAHVREQIAQVLATVPGERLFRPEFGAGVQRLVFEPNSQPIWELTKKRLMASLGDALQGEVDPRTLEVEVDGSGGQGGMPAETLRIVIRYQLASIGERQEQSFTVDASGVSHG
jgi:hypothetical protein